MWGNLGEFIGELGKGVGILSDCVKIWKDLSVLFELLDTSPKAQYDNLCCHCETCECNAWQSTNKKQLWILWILRLCLSMTMKRHFALNAKKFYLLDCHANFFKICSQWQNRVRVARSQWRKQTKLLLKNAYKNLENSQTPLTKFSQFSLALQTFIA